MAIRIFIDQGHNPGGVNAGAEGNGLYEQDVTYEVGRQLGQLLTATGNYEVLLSRNSPDEILGTSNASSLAARTNAANEWGADWFISIHANASTNQTATGSEGYVYSLESPERGVFARPSLYVLRKSAMPATLIELGFITTPAEAYLMETDPSAFAKGMFNGIQKFFGFSE